MNRNQQLERALSEVLSIDPSAENSMSLACAAIDRARAIMAEPVTLTGRHGFHTSDGWCFTRHATGVSIHGPNGERHDMTDDVWCSVVASMSTGGEGELRWYAAKAFHESRGQVCIIAKPNEPSARDIVESWEFGYSLNVTQKGGGRRWWITVRTGRGGEAWADEKDHDTRDAAFAAAAAWILAHGGERG